MKNPFNIRRMQPEDAEDIKGVALKSWKYTYSGIYSKEEIKRQIDRYYSIKGLRQTIKYNHRDLFDFIVLEDTRTDKIIGYAQIGYDKFYEDDPTVLDNDINLFRIYLHPDYIGMELGKKLLVRAEEFVRKKGENSYFLYVHKDNTIGKKFYRKMGFENIEEKNREDELYMEKHLE